MKTFMDSNFLLETDTARELYHNHAIKMPIIDYHCHLDPESIANNRQFDNLGQIWLEGDHYKWRAMRTNGVDERYITGKETTYWEKFEKWAETVPYTMRNPLYHWTHLELQRAFGVNSILNPGTAKLIYDTCTEKLRKPEFSAKGLMQKFNVEVVCTTDDPVDSLEHHFNIKNQNFNIKVLPAWRPDKVMTVDQAENYKKYISKLESVSGINISTYNDLIAALRIRHDFFASAGCKLSDHGTDTFYAEEYSYNQVNSVFKKALSGSFLTNSEIALFKSAILIDLAELDWEKGWTQQFHFGVIRNNNSKMFESVGADTGFDSIGDFSIALSLAKFLDKLNFNNKLAKTILYNLNPRDNSVIATMIGNFQDGETIGKIQFGSGWWFMDQKFGMEAQMNSLSSLGLISRFVGMLTDSRSFLSYPRHEYFRRILCNLIGNDIEKGELPSSEFAFISQMVKDICYYNAKNYFQF